MLKIVKKIAKKIRKKKQSNTQSNIESAPPSYVDSISAESFTYIDKPPLYEESVDGY